MTFKVRLKKGRRSITTSGDSLMSARGKALAEWQKKYNERAEGATFETIEGESKPAPKPKPKGKGEAKSKRQAKPRTDNPSAPKPAPKPEPPKKKAPPTAQLADAGRAAYLDRIILGWSGRRPAEAHLMTGRGSLQAAQRLAESGAISGRDRTVLSIHSAYTGGRGGGAGGSVDPSGLMYGDRMVLAFDGRGRLVEWHAIPGTSRSLDEAAALAQSDRIGGATRVVATVHSTYR